MQQIEIQTAPDQTEIAWTDGNGNYYTAKEARELDDLEMEVWKDEAISTLQ